MRLGAAALALSALAAVPARAADVPADQAPRAPAANGLGLQLLDAPVGARDDPRARLYIVDHVAPGTVARRRIKITNTTTSAIEVALYPAAATIRRGAFLGAAGHARNALSTWTSVGPRTTEVPANGATTATVRIAVPRDAAPKERYGVVWAEARAAAPGGRGITLVSRVGIRIYLSVGPGGAPAADFTIDALTAARTPDGRPAVLAKAHNTGGRALDVSGTLRLVAGPGGLTAGPFDASLGTTLAIGDTEPIMIALDKRVPAGPWGARVTLRSGLLKRSARATITFPGETESSGPPVTAIAIGLLLALVIAATVAAVRRRA